MIAATRQERRALAARNRQQPLELCRVPRTEWPPTPAPPGLMQVWRSRDFLVQVFEAPPPAEVRLSVCRTCVQTDGRWGAGIAWDALWAIKRQVGWGDWCAVEVFPPDAEVINVANMRHLWVLKEPPAFMWRRTP